VPFRGRGDRTVYCFHLLFGLASQDIKLSNSGIFSLAVNTQRYNNRWRSNSNGTRKKRRVI